MKMMELDLCFTTKNENRVLVINERHRTMDWESHDLFRVPN